MTELEIKAQAEKLNLEIGEIKKKVEASELQIKDIFGLKDQVEAAKSAIEKLSVIEGKSHQEYLQNMQKQLDSLEAKTIEQGLEGKNKVLTYNQQIEKAFKSDEFKQFAQAKREGKKGIAFDLELKALTTGDITPIGTNAIAFALTQTQPGIGMYQNNPLAFYNLLRKGTTSKDYVEWLERNAETNNAAVTAENALIPTSTLTFVEKSEKCKKIADSFVVTNESLENNDFMMSEIMNFVGTNIPNIRETQIYSGDGSATQLNGLTNIAKAFAKPTGQTAITSPDEYDVLKTAVLQVLLGNTTLGTDKIGFSANAIFVNPVDFANLTNIRTTDGVHKYPELLNANPTIVGIPVIISTRITAGSFLVGDFSKATFSTMRGLSLKLWDQNGTDPMYDRVTITGSERAALWYKTPDKFGFVKGTFSAAKTALSA